MHSTVVDIEPWVAVTPPLVLPATPLFQFTSPCITRLQIPWMAVLAVTFLVSLTVVVEIGELLLRNVLVVSKCVFVAADTNIQMESAWEFVDSAA